MTNNPLITRADAWIAEYGTGNDYMAGTINLIQSLRNALANQADGWRDASKELPQEDGRYWVYSEYSNGNGWLGYARYFAGSWECVDDGFHPDDHRITHWQPLPKPPTSGE